MANETRKHNYDVQAGVYTANHYINIRQAACLGQHDLLAKAGSLALEQMDLAFDFIEDPSKILGSPLTKHGEISEQFTVRTINAYDAIDRLVTNPLELRADIDNIARTGPVDYTVDGVNIQSKYCESLSSSVGRSHAHNGTYADFSEMGGRYHIPKDQHAELTEILAGRDVDGISTKVAERIRNDVTEWADANQLTAEELVQSGRYTYDEVQCDKAADTLSRERANINDRIEERAAEINEEHSASFREGAAVTVKAAAAGAAISAVCQMVKMSINGKNVLAGDYTSEDWKNIAVNSATVGAYAGGAAAINYTLNTMTKIGPRTAAAITGAIAGMVTAGFAYGAGKISTSELASTTLVLSASSAATVGIGAMLGTMIPIPVLGPIVGATVATGMVDIVKNLTTDCYEGMNKEMSETEKRVEDFVRSDRSRTIDRIQGIRNRAFAAYGSDDLNASMIAMGRLCIEAGIDDSELVADVSSLEAFVNEHLVYVGELVTD